MIIWNGKLFREKGIIVENIPVISKGKKRINKYQIDGRNGFIAIDEETYDSFVISISCHLDTNKTNIDEVKEFLDGYGTLSFDGKREYTAMIQNQIDFSKVMQFRKFIIQFLCNPISQDIEVSRNEILENSSNLEILDATAKMYPILEVVGEGDISITFNNKTFYLYGLNPLNTYTLDCENKVIIDQNNNNAANLMRYDFPYLNPGVNVIEYTGSISSLVINYRKAYL